jgi:hypothetical protein
MGLELAGRIRHSVVKGSDGASPSQGERLTTPATSDARLVAAIGGVDVLSLARRDFLKLSANGLAMAWLCGLAISRRAMASAAPAMVVQWLWEVEDLAREMKSEKLAQADWQRQMEALYQRVPLSDLLQLIDFTALVRRAQLPARGELFETLSLPRIDGFPSETAFYRGLAGFKKGRSIPPHGHNHLVSSFLVLQGELRGRHFDRLRDDGEHVWITPTIDRTFHQGDFSTISQTRDNVHWFTAEQDNCFMMDFGVAGLTSTGITLAPPNQATKTAGRVYLDVTPELLPRSKDGTRVTRLSEAEAYRIYGS